MQNYKEEEQEIERLVNRLVEGVAEDVMVDNDQWEDSLHELMDVDMGQAAIHLLGSIYKLALFINGAAPFISNMRKSEF